LADTIAKCLNVNPTLRPSAEQLAAFPEVGLDLQDEEEPSARGRGGETPMSHRRAASEQKLKNKIDLLGTIKLPRNLK